MDTDRSAPHLPVELLEQIFRHFRKDRDQGTLAACALVSKSWEPCARAHLYHTVSVGLPQMRGHTTRSVCDTLAGLHTLLDAAPDVAPLVHVLRLPWPCDTHVALPALLRRLPSLRGLSLWAPRGRRQRVVAFDGLAPSAAPGHAPLTAARAWLVFSSQLLLPHADSTPPAETAEQALLDVFACFAAVDTLFVDHYEGSYHVLPPALRWPPAPRVRLLRFGPIFHGGRRTVRDLLAGLVRGGLSAFVSPHVGGFWTAAHVLAARVQPELAAVILRCPLYHGACPLTVYSVNPGLMRRRRADAGRYILKFEHCPHIRLLQLPLFFMGGAHAPLILQSFLLSQTHAPAPALHTIVLHADATETYLWELAAPAWAREQDLLLAFPALRRVVVDVERGASEDQRAELVRLVSGKWTGLVDRKMLQFSDAM